MIGIREPTSIDQETASELAVKYGHREVALWLGVGVWGGAAVCRVVLRRGVPPIIDPGDHPSKSHGGATGDGGATPPPPSCRVPGGVAAAWPPVAPHRPTLDDDDPQPAPAPAPHAPLTPRPSAASPPTSPSPGPSARRPRCATPPPVLRRPSGITSHSIVPISAPATPPSSKSDPPPPQLRGLARPQRPCPPRPFPEPFTELLRPCVFTCTTTACLFTPLS